MGRRMVWEPQVRQVVRDLLVPLFLRSGSVHALADTRNLARGLHPVELDTNGLMSALRELAERTSAQVPCQFQCAKDIPIRNTQAAAQSLLLLKRPQKRRST